ncbi:MAG: hypothetical protein IPG93_02850 [Burkholderiales bacterium]|nr:hypothetical protein [Burkholderiales bacterium]
MDDNLFLPEWRVVAYLLVATALCVAVYRARSLMQFAWGAPGMNSPAGGGRIRQVDEYDTISVRAATGGINVLNSMTPGGAAALLVLMVWLAGAAFGMLVLPAAFGAMSRVSTLNVVFVALGGLAVAFTLSRLTATIIAWGSVLAILSVLAAGAVAALMFIATFLSGGLSGQLGGVWDGVQEEVSSISELTDPEKSDLGRKLSNTVKFNGCVIAVSVETVGDMRRARMACDKAWVVAQKQDRLHDRQDEALARQESDDWLRKTGLDIPTVRISSYSETLVSTWYGVLSCPNSAHHVFLRLQGQAGQAAGVVQVFPAGRRKPGGVESFAAYRVSAAKSGQEVQIKLGEAISKGIGMPTVPTLFSYRAAFIPNLVANSVEPGCKLMLKSSVQ